MANRVIQPKAIRSGQKARVALAGPTGSGKTWTSLDIATVLADGKGILVIDTERGSASLYGDEYDFAVVDWAPPYNPKELAAFVTEQSRNFGCIVIDSLTHFWEGEGGLLSIVDDAGRQNGGNSYAGWKKGTPIQAGMVDAILAANCHTVVTMRSKMAYEMTKNAKTGKTEIEKLGLAPIQRGGIEYEWAVAGELDEEHRLTISKSRCHPLADRTFPAGKAKEMAKILVEWLSSAAAQEAPPPAATPEPEADTAALIPPPPESVKKTGVVAGKDEAAAITKEYAAVTEMAVTSVQRWARQKLEAAGVKLPPAAEWTAKDYGIYTAYVKDAMAMFLARKKEREEADKSAEQRELETVQL